MNTGGPTGRPFCFREVYLANRGIFHFFRFMGDLNRKKAWELLPLLVKKEVSSLELTDACLAEIDRTGKKLNSFITVMADSARKKAREVDDKLSKGRPVG